MTRARQTAIACGTVQDFNGRHEQWASEATIQAWTLDIEVGEAERALELSFSPWRRCDPYGFGCRA